MARFVLEQVIAAPRHDVFAAALDPELHVRTMARYGETMVEAPAGGVFTEGSSVTWQARHFGIPFRLRSTVSASIHRTCSAIGRSAGRSHHSCTNTRSRNMPAAR